VEPRKEEDEITPTFPHIL